MLFFNFSSRMGYSCILSLNLISSSCLLKNEFISNNLLMSLYLVSLTSPTSTQFSSLYSLPYGIISQGISMFGLHNVIFLISHDEQVARKMYLFQVIYLNFLHSLIWILNFELWVVCYSNYINLALS